MTDDSSSPSRSDPDPRDASIEDRTRELHHHLEATAELPIDREANRWLGEAEAIAADVATSDLDEATVRERVSKIRRLLSEIDETGHEAADDRLAAAERSCAAILDRGTARPSDE